MKVYRYLNETELKNIIYGNMAEIGKEYYIVKKDKKNTGKLNTHNYVKGEKYLHFFKTIADIEYIRQERRDSAENFYFAEFEIPLSVLFFSAGKGYYGTLQGYDSCVDKVSEFAVKVKNFNSSWLVRYALDENKQYLMRKKDYSIIKLNQPVEKET